MQKPFDLELQNLAG